jgi:transcription antitermination factor NusG
MSSPFWVVARCLPHSLKLALTHIEANGFEPFAPLLQTRTATTQMLFAGYVFVLVVERPWQILRRTVGVMSVVMTGDCPSRCPDHEIAVLKARVDERGVIRLPPPPGRRKFAKGEQVQILAGPFQGLAAIHSGMSTRAREIILLEMLGGQRQVAIDRALVLPCRSPPAPAGRFGGKMAAWEAA